jgi:hypothetical protein
VIPQRVVLSDKFIARKPDYVGHLKSRRIHCPYRLSRGLFTTLGVT